VTVEAQPRVQLIAIQPVHDDVNNCSIQLMLILNNISELAHILVFSPASAWEEELNQIDLIKEIGRVKVFKSASSTSIMKVEVVFLTNFNVLEDQIPAIELNDTITCSNSSVELILTANSSVSQDLVPTSSIMIGFNHTFSEQPRYTTISLNSTRDEINLALKDLISWGCIEDENIYLNTDLYQTYEDGSLVRGHSFCGIQSKQNPSVVRNSNNAYELNSVPYVSNTC